MKSTDKTLLEQMEIGDFEVSNRKELFEITSKDEKILKEAKPYIEDEIDSLVDEFYEFQTEMPDISLLIGDADTLNRLKQVQKIYILDLFSGYYDLEYINNRLRIGMVHKRIGVEPKLYLAAIQLLKRIIIKKAGELIPEDAKALTVSAIEKMVMFDVALVFDTYIRSLIQEIEISKQRTEDYASSLEVKVRDRTEQLEKLSRTDALTGLLNRQHLDELLLKSLRAAQRRNEPLTVAYVDVNDFKIINDTRGHRYGDEILKNVAASIKSSSRMEDLCFRYGGDEFCVLMPNCKKEDALNEWGQRVIRELEEQKDSPKLSIGYAQTGPEDYVSSEELMQKADEEMYLTKKKMKSA